MKEQILKMEKEIEQLKLENKEKEDALIELSQFYYVSDIFLINIINYFIYSIIKIKMKVMLSMKKKMKRVKIKAH